MASSKTLLTIEEAAGYAMAPPADEMDAPSSMVVTRSLDEALRLGHVSAARPGHGNQALVISRTMIEPAKSALRGVMAGWWHPKLHA